MELIERVEQLERDLKGLRPELHFPSTATLEQRLRWLEIVLEEMRARDNHGVYAETLNEEKLKQLLAHTVYIKQDRITLHSLTADPASCGAGDKWFRSDLGKEKLAIDAVVANARLLRREMDVIPSAEIAELHANKITTGRFLMARMPAGTLGQVLTAQGDGSDPAYADVDVPVIVRKTADEIVNNSSTLQNDDALLFAVGANEVWEFHLFMLITSSLTPKFKLAITKPTGGSILALEQGAVSGTAPTANTGSSRTQSTDTTATRIVTYWGVYIGGDNAGNVQVQWAQSTANESDTKVLANSFIIVHKLD